MTTVKLTDLMKEKFPAQFEQDDSQKLVAGIYHVKDFSIHDTANFGKLLRLVTEEGKFRTTGKAVVGLFLQSAGTIVSEQNKKGNSVEVEIINKKANTGRIALAVKAFDNPIPA